MEALIIEDQMQDINTIKSALRTENIKSIEVAYNITEALTILSKEIPKIIFISQKHLKGKEFIKFFIKEILTNKECPQTPSLFLTLNETKPSKLKKQASFVADIFIKPLDQLSIQNSIKQELFNTGEQVPIAKNISLKSYTIESPTYIPIEIVELSEFHIQILCEYPIIPNETIFLHSKQLEDLFGIKKYITGIIKEVDKYNEKEIINEKTGEYKETLFYKGYIKLQALSLETKKAITSHTINEGANLPKRKIKIDNG